MKDPEVKSLFKYKPLNHFSLDIIVNERVFYPKPEYFNDPFDTQCSFRSSSAIIQVDTASGLKKYISGTNSGKITAYTKKDFSSEIGKFKEELKNFGVLSLAEDSKNILMWSHYADDHKGICIEFERSPENELGNLISTRKVIYTKGYPSLSAKTLLTPNIRDETLMRVLHTKSEHWSYEKEWRHFRNLGGKAYPIPGKILSIIFGARTSEVDLSIVKKIVGKSIPLFQAQLKENEFSIKFKRII